MTMQQPTAPILDRNATIDPMDVIVERIVAKVLERLMSDDEIRQRAQRIRDAKLADIRAFEDMYGIKRALPTKAERENEILERDLHPITPKTKHHNR